MIRQSAAAMEERRGTDTQRDKLTAAVQAPLRKIIESDPAAVKAVEAAADFARQQAEAFEPKLPAYPSKRLQDIPIFIPTGARATQLFPIPFHYFWRWHDGQAPVTSQADRPTGNVALDVSPGSNAKTNAHAGFGVSLTTDRFKTVMARTLRNSTYSYLVSGGYFGGSATVEGGIEMTVMENGQLLRHGFDKRFRRRASNGETFQFDLGFFESGEPLELTWPMFPGSGYTLNVGAWLFGENQHGFGAGGFSWAQASLRAQVLLMSVFDL